LEITAIATNQEGHEHRSYTDLVVNELQKKLREFGVRELHFCISFQPNAQEKIPNRREVVMELLDFTLRNKPHDLSLHEIRVMNIGHSEKAYEILSNIQCIKLESESETEVCQSGTYWAGGLKKEMIQSKIDKKNKLLHLKKNACPNIPHWLVMVIENHEGSSAAFWEEHAYNAFDFDYDACFIFEMVPPKYIELKKTESAV
jgi:hypothetical protein